MFPASLGHLILVSLASLLGLPGLAQAAGGEPGALSFLHTGGGNTLSLGQAGWMGAALARNKF